MVTALPRTNFPSPRAWWNLVLPKEHGSWSLAFEPLAFGLIAAPSAAGAWLALAVAGAFFARRPLRTAWRDADAGRRSEARGALLVCAVLAVAAFTAAIATAGVTWLIWLAPAAIAGGIFLSFDLRNSGRAQVSEVAGATAFALLSAPLAVLGGASSATAMAIGLVMCGRAIPTVLSVRAVLRAAKTGVRQSTLPLAAPAAFLGAAIALAWNGLAPTLAAIGLAVLAARSFVLLEYPRPVLRARTIGMIEAVLGILFIATVATAWRP